MVNSLFTVFSELLLGFTNIESCGDEIESHVQSHPHPPSTRHTAHAKRGEINNKEPWHESKSK